MIDPDRSNFTRLDDRNAQRALRGPGVASRSIGVMPIAKRAYRRVRLRSKHTVRLLREVSAFTVLNGVWWFLPLVVVLVLLALAVTATQQVVPYAVYTLF